MMPDNEFDKLSWNQRSQYIHGLHQTYMRLLQDCFMLINALIQKRMMGR